MNNDAISEIKEKITEMMLPEALQLIRKAVPADTNLMLLKANINMLEYDYHSGIISEETYRVRKANQRNALLFFLDKMKEATIIKVYEVFFDTLPKKKQIVAQGTGYKTKISFIASSPNDADPLQINVEYDKIKNAISSSLFRDNWELLPPIMAATIDSMLTCLVSAKPSIVHFAGHAGTKGIILNDELNNYEVIKTDVLKNIFSKLNTTCIFLNGCYSAEVAKELSLFSSYVIGMNTAFGDITASIFSSSFYSLLCNSEEKDYLTSFSLAKSVLMVKKQHESSTPEIWKNGEKITS